MGRKVFSKEDADKIWNLLQRKARATRSEQKVIRASIRRIGFYISDFTSSADGFTTGDFDDLVERGELTIVDGPGLEPMRSMQTLPAGRTLRKRMDHQTGNVVLPDVLDTGMKVVFCGTAVGEKSARRGAYYAGPGNQFWNILKEIGLTPNCLRPEEYPSLVQYKIGLTDLVKGRFGQDTVLAAHDFDIGSFRGKIQKYAPKAVGFNGKKAAQIALDTASIEYGRQNVKIGSATVFVLPSTSGAARGFWDPQYWHQIAVFVGL